MSWNVLLSEAFEKQVSKLNAKLVNMIYKKLQILQSSPDYGKRLTAELKDCRVLKVSKYRIIYRVLNETHTVKVDAVELREKGYERFKRSVAL